MSSDRFKVLTERTSPYLKQENFHKELEVIAEAKL